MAAGSDPSSEALEAYSSFLSELGTEDAVGFEAFLGGHPSLSDDLLALDAVHGDLRRLVERAASEERASRSLGGRMRDELGIEPGSGVSLQGEGEAGADEEEGVLGSRYRAMGEVGRGGMGVVLKVWDKELRRANAMKIIRGADEKDGGGPTDSRTRKLTERFLEEAQITAQLDHPGILPVHELGIGREGEVYFTMQLVKGIDLTEVFKKVEEREERWTRTRALHALLKVCEAMAYAHDKDVVHRDLKPANVMVGKYGEVYVMDWGLARVMGRTDPHDVRLRSGTEQISLSIRTDREDARESDRDSSLYTMDGDIIGTPAYMSLEQARGDLEQLGPHSDVYAVGAMLYHLTTGQCPYVTRGERLSPHALIGLLLTTDPVPAEKLAPRMPAELASIIAKAMAREAADRYRTMGELAEDLRAYLDNWVVRAHANGAWAEARKWVRRNRALAVVGGALAATLVAATVVTVSLWRDAHREAEMAREARGDAVREAELAEEARGAAMSEMARAETARARAVNLADFLAELLRKGDPEVAGGGRGRTVLDLSEDALAELESGRFDDDTESKATLLATIGESLLNNGRLLEARPALEEALALREQSANGWTAGLVEALRLFGGFLLVDGDPEAAVPLFERALEGAEALDGDGAMAASVRIGLADALVGLGRFEEALPLGQRAIEVLRALEGEEVQLATALNLRALTLQLLGRYGEAMASGNEALDVALEAGPEGEPLLIVALNTLGTTALQQSDWFRAEAMFREALDRARSVYSGDHPYLAGTLQNLASALTGAPEEAVTLYREAADMHRRLHGGDHPDLAITLSNLAASQAQTGDLDGALATSRTAVEMAARVFPEGHPDRASIEATRGDLLLDAEGRDG